MTGTVHSGTIFMAGLKANDYCDANLFEMVCEGNTLQR